MKQGSILSANRGCRGHNTPIQRCAASAMLVLLIKLLILRWEPPIMPIMLERPNRLERICWVFSWLQCKMQNSARMQSAQRTEPVNQCWLNLSETSLIHMITQQHVVTVTLLAGVLAFRYFVCSSGLLYCRTQAKNRVLMLPLSISRNVKTVS